jgi:nucleotide-binding universal stress UspA family protein
MTPKPRKKANTMNKIIAAFDGLKFSESTRDYAIFLAKRSHAHLVGVFLDDFTYHSYKVYDLVREDGWNGESRQKILEHKDLETRAAAVHKFEIACRTSGIEFSIHHDRNIAIRELLHESVYADLLIINSRETLTRYNERLPTRFNRDLLSNALCPVLLVPHKFRPITNLVLLFDGEPSSVHAIKMFSYTLCSLKQYPAEVLTVQPVKQSSHVPDNRLMKEFIKRHFPTAAFKVLKGYPEIEIENYLKERNENSLVVLGAYRRNAVSRWLNQSMADTLMKDLNVPLFIAHNK